MFIRIPASIGSADKTFALTLRQSSRADARRSGQAKVELDIARRNGLCGV
jgi:hypothetical protein